MQLGIAPEVLRELHAQRADALRRIALDQARRGVRLYLTVRTAAPLRGIAEALRRHRGEDALAARYRTLAGLPSGSLGRMLFTEYRASGYPLPGEVGGLDESLVPRDLLRILGGFASDETGDDALQGFLAGLARLPLGRRVVLDTIAERCAAMHLAGTLAAGGMTQHLDPATFGAAYDRGVAASAELVRGWAWWGMMASDVGALRLRYGIRVARTVRVPAPAAGTNVPARAKSPRAA